MYTSTDRNDEKKKKITNIKSKHLDVSGKSQKYNKC